MEEISFKYLNEDLTTEEWKQLRVWLKASPENRATLDKLLSYTSNVSKERELLRLEIWDDLKERIAAEGQTSKILPLKAQKTTYALWYKVAAVFLVVGFLSFLASDLILSGTVEDSLFASVEITNPGQKKRTILPDGTMVTLNAGSKLVYPKIFVNGKREVLLEGEAFFDVKRDVSRPFIIHAGELQVEVLGTSFDVRSYESDESAYVSVASGKVQVSNASRETIVEPGEAVAYDKKSQLLVEAEFDGDRAFGWMNNLIVFKGETLPQILEKLSLYYGVTIENKAKVNAIAKKGFSGKFSNAPLSEVLKGLSYIYEFKYQIKNDKVEIR